jgi:hypothetical protein
MFVSPDFQPFFQIATAAPAHRATRRNVEPLPIVSGFGRLLRIHFRVRV